MTDYNAPEVNSKLKEYKHLYIYQIRETKEMTKTAVWTKKHSTRVAAAGNPEVQNAALFIYLLNFFFLSFFSSVFLKRETERNMRNSVRLNKLNEYQSMRKKENIARRH